MGDVVLGEEVNERLADAQIEEMKLRVQGQPKWLRFSEQNTVEERPAQRDLKRFEEYPP